LDESLFVKGDIVDYDAILNASKGMDAIALLGAYSWDYPFPYTNPPGYGQMWNVNVDGPFNVLEACVRNKINKVVYASSACAVGFMTWGNSHEIEYFPVDENHPCKSWSLYGMGKHIIEDLCYLYTKKFGISTISFRIGTSWYPPGYHEEMTSMFRENMIKMSNREPLDGSCRDQAWYYVGVKDVAQAFLLGLENQNIEYGVYNLGADESGSDLDSLEIA
jgi:UDP-glucose 4-epimerase